MNKVWVEKRELEDITAQLEQLQAKIAEITAREQPVAPDPVETPVDPDADPAVVEHDALCYIQRYPGIRNAVAGKSREAKIRYASAHYENWGRGKGLIWGCREEPAENLSEGVKDIRSAPSGMLWKPIADSRGGVPVALTPKDWNQVARVRLYYPDGREVNVPEVFERGRTNGERETYFFMGMRAASLPKNMIIDFDQHGRWLIPDPTLRYD